MCVKLTFTLRKYFYTCRMTIALRVYSGNQNCFLKYLKHSFLLLFLSERVRDSQPFLLNLYQELVILRQHNAIQHLIHQNTLFILGENKFNFSNIKLFTKGRVSSNHIWVLSNINIPSILYLYIYIYIYIFLTC